MGIPGQGKGRKKLGGRQKGTPNKLTRELKEMILQALENSGGVEYLTEQAKVNPTAFLTLLGKVLPLTLSGDGKNPVTIVLSSEAASVL